MYYQGRTLMSFLKIVFIVTVSLSLLFTNSVNAEDDKKIVVVETQTPGSGPKVTTDHRYRSMVTLYIENDDGTRTPSGWSTRVSDGAKKDEPFEFRPGQNLIQGWTDGVLQMVEGERALLHIPSALGYGDRPMGSPNGAFYIPASSNLLFDIEVLGKVIPPEKQDL